MADQEDCELRVEERWLAERFGRLLGDIRRRADDIIGFQDQMESNGALSLK